MMTKVYELWLPIAFEQAINYKSSNSNLYFYVKRKLWVLFMQT